MDYEKAWHTLDRRLKFLAAERAKYAASANAQKQQRTYERHVTWERAYLSVIDQMTEITGRG